MLLATIKHTHWSRLYTEVTSRSTVSGKKTDTDVVGNYETNTLITKQEIINKMEKSKQVLPSLPTRHIHGLWLVITFWTFPCKIDPIKSAPSWVMTYNIVTAGLEGCDHHLNLSAKYISQTRGFVHTMVLSARHKWNERQSNDSVFCSSLGFCKHKAKHKNESAHLPLFPWFCKVKLRVKDKAWSSRSSAINSLGSANSNWSKWKAKNEPNGLLQFPWFCKYKIIYQ